jgi:Ser/Thr protein kinase RdoA (MazF antagonist)
MLSTMYRRAGNTTVTAADHGVITEGSPPVANALRHRGREFAWEYRWSVNEVDQPLEGGNSTTGVVRVGDTVRKPWSAATPAVIEFMAAVRRTGVDVPDVLGRDDQGRLILEFVPGTLAMDAGPLTARDLERVGRIVRSIHDAGKGFEPTVTPHWAPAITPPGNDLICHGDLAPWNLIIGDRWVFIDWDAASPSTRLWDLAYAAQTFAVNDLSLNPPDAAEQLAAFVAGYGADETLRTALPTAIVQRVNTTNELLRSSKLSGIEPWADMHASDHGEHWRAALTYVTSNRATWVDALTRQAPN